MILKNQEAILLVFDMMLENSLGLYVCMYSRSPISFAQLNSSLLSLALETKAMIAESIGSGNLTPDLLPADVFLRRIWLILISRKAPDPYRIIRRHAFVMDILRREEEQPVFLMTEVLDSFIETTS